MSSGPPQQPYQDPYGQLPQGQPPVYPPQPQYQQPYQQQPPQGQYPPQQQYQQPPQQVAYPHQPMNVPGRAGKFQGAFPCPRCGSPDVQDVKMTWWGGVVGPAAMNLVKCKNCRMQYNAKTLKDAKTAITVYAIVGTVVGLIIGIGIVVVQNR